MADTARAIDGLALVRAQQRLVRAAEPPWLHAEVARRMAERLAVVKTAPLTLIDWWSRAGASAERLRKAYPKARVIRVEPVATTAPRSRWWSRLRGDAAVTMDAGEVPPESVQLVWANMMLHAVADPGVLLAQWKQALSVDGFLMFSTLGPDTLKTLRALYAEAGWGPPHAPFVDMHDLGDMLVRAGFADPVMDQELLRLTWATPAALLAELRTLGANADPARHAGLRTPRWRSRLETALAARAAADGRIALEFEVVYGHAFRPAPRVAVEGETRVSAEQLQRMARAGRGGGSVR
jgi:malonyl-CoA O-methyltransferase